MPDINDGESPPAFEEVLAESIETLSRSEDTDMSLLHILSGHIVTSSPTADAVDQAVKAIESLAVERGESVD